jgi:hypothetical protein
MSKRKTVDERWFDWWLKNYPQPGNRPEKFALEMIRDYSRAAFGAGFRSGREKRKGH